MSQQGILSDLTTSGADIETVTGDTGGAIGPDAAHNLNIVGSGGITTSGSGNTLTINGAGEVIIDITSLDDTDSPYTVLSADYYMSCDVSAGVLTTDLPDAPTTGHVFIIKDSAGNSAANPITVTTVSGVVTIDGATSRTMSTNYEALQFVFNGTSYEVF